MKPIPVAFHIGPLEVHTYGIGLAITFWFAYRYFERRLAKNGFRTDWVVGLFVWVIVAAIVGARAAHVLSNFSFYTSQPGQILQIWHGGLSSFGGLILAVPTGLWITRRRCPELTLSRALDIVVPVLVAAWALGRLLGPQLMVAGGGHPTHQWFGMYYADQVGKRLPVPIFQATEDFAVYLVLMAIERRLVRWPDRSLRAGYPAGIITGAGMTLWGIERFIDQRLWLSYPGHLGSVLTQAAAGALIVGGLVVLAFSRRAWARWLEAGAPGGHPGSEGPGPDGGDGSEDAGGSEGDGDGEREGAGGDEDAPAVTASVGAGVETGAAAPGHGHQEPVTTPSETDPPTS